MTINDYRLDAGLSTADTLTLLSISRRTWQRWITKNKSPAWAHRLIEAHSGRLDRHGWKDWEIRAGNLYCNHLHHSYHWQPGDLLAALIAPAKYPHTQGKS